MTRLTIVLRQDSKMMGRTYKVRQAAIILRIVLEQDCRTMTSKIFRARKVATNLKTEHKQDFKKMALRTFRVK